jgi:fatty-acyl-CoA synthase
VIAVPDETWGSDRRRSWWCGRATRSPPRTSSPTCVDSSHYKAPDTVTFVDELPKTSTGKIQKFQLREKEWAGHDKRIRG